VQLTSKVLELLGQVLVLSLEVLADFEHFVELGLPHHADLVPLHLGGVKLVELELLLDVPDFVNSCGLLFGLKFDLPLKRPLLN